MSTWIARLESPYPDDDPTARLRVAVKDAIDVAGVPTTAGCLAVARTARPAPSDALCLTGYRKAGAVLVGKTNLDELCLSATGVNAAFGTPVNPLAPDRIPGGSSSGSAVAVASGEADMALGTDTGGSVRIPAACCGIVGLKTTWGRVSTQGVWPLSPCIDTVGPLAPDMAGIIRAMELLEPDWEVSPYAATRIGRLRIPGVDPLVEAAVDAALQRAGFEVVDVVLAGWDRALETFGDILLYEFWQAHADLLDVEGVTGFARAALRRGAAITSERRTAASEAQRVWKAEIGAALHQVDLLALPTLMSAPPLLADARDYPAVTLTAPFNVAGVPALSMPVPVPTAAQPTSRTAAQRPVPTAAQPTSRMAAQPTRADREATADPRLPASLQLVGPHGCEDVLCATGLAVEAALA